MKAREIRAEVRKAMKMSDAELVAWFQERIRSEKEVEANRTTIESLELLYDALLKESKRAKPKGQRATGRSKTKV